MNSSDSSQQNILNRVNLSEKQVNSKLYNVSQENKGQSKDHSLADQHRSVTKKQNDSSVSKQGDSSINHSQDQDCQENANKKQGFHERKQKRIRKNRSINSNNQSHRQGSIASNLNKKFTETIKQFLVDSKIQANFETDYIARFNMHGQKENIMILPFLLLDCLLTNCTKISHENHGYQKQTYYIAQKSEWIQNINKGLLKIFKRLKAFLQNSYKNKVTKSLKNSDNPQFNHEMHSIAVYIEIAQFLTENIPDFFVSYASHKAGSRQSPMAQKKKTEEYKIKSKSQYEQMLDNLFKVKQRDLEKAKDKFRSIQLGTNILRSMFGISWKYKVPIRELLERSIEQQQKREYGLKKKSNRWYAQKFYDQILSKKQQNATKIKVQERGNMSVNCNEQSSLGQDFLMALMCVSLLRRKNKQILKELITLIERYIEFMDEDESAFMYGKKTYLYYVQLLARKELKSEAQQVGKQQKGVQYRIEEWIYPIGLIKVQTGLSTDQSQYKNVQIPQIESIRLIITGFEQIREQFRGQNLSREGMQLHFFCQTGH